MGIRIGIGGIEIGSSSFSWSSYWESRLDTWHEGLIDIEADNIQYQFTTPLMLVTFDEGNINVFTGVEPVLTSRGLTGTVYVTTDFTTAGGDYMSWANLAALAAKGWAIQDHSEDHANYADLSEAELDAEFAAVDAAFIANSLPTPTHLAYPFGSADALAEQVAAENRLTARGVDGAGFYVFQRNVNQYYLPCFGGDVVTTAQGMIDCKALIDKAVANKSCIIFNFHDMYAGRVTAFTTLVDYAMAAGVTLINIETLKETYLP